MSHPREHTLVWIADPQPRLERLVTDLARYYTDTGEFSFEEIRARYSRAPFREIKIPQPVTGRTPRLQQVRPEPTPSVITSREGGQESNIWQTIHTGRLSAIGLGSRVLATPQSQRSVTHAYNSSLHRAEVNSTSISTPRPVLSASRITSISNIKTPAPSKVRDPFDPHIRSAILTTLDPPLRTYQGFHDHRPTVKNAALRIEKTLRIMHGIGKSKTKENVPTHSCTIAFECCGQTEDKDVFCVHQKLGEGGYARVYLATLRSVAPASANVIHKDEKAEVAALMKRESSAWFALKVESPLRSLTWEFYILRSLHARIPPTIARRFLLETRALHLYSDEGYLLIEHDGSSPEKAYTLLAAINACLTKGTTVDEGVAAFLVSRVLRAMNEVHKAGILHGDLKMDNILLQLRGLQEIKQQGNLLFDPEKRNAASNTWENVGVTLIDFGHGVDMTRFPPNTLFVQSPERTRNQAQGHGNSWIIPEARENRPWSFEIDYFGIAGIAHCLLFGRFLKLTRIPQHSSRNVDSPFKGAKVKNTKGNIKYKPAEPLKRYWRVDLWSRFFDRMLNPRLVREDGSLPLEREIQDLVHDLEKLVWERQMGQGGKSLGNLLLTLECWIREQKDVRIHKG
ncbi:uncharacterized protein VTP21DRAFT_6525 [Calcarisporiella thermophila]|uniref:uncharacterized protein n=1 Tax=Calcarisporiella thermophila TaxID=911321 RepID=UPI0037440A0C